MSRCSRRSCSPLDRPPYAPGSCGSTRPTRRRWPTTSAGLTCAEKGIEPAGQEIRVARPPGGHVVPVLDDVGGQVVLPRPPQQERRPTAAEVATRGQRALHFGLNRRRIGAVVPASP